MYGWQFGLWDQPSTLMPTYTPLAERFWNKVDLSAGVRACWPWQAARMKNGYGVIGADGRRRMLLAHRVSLQLMNIEVPDDMEVDHVCRNRRCVNPLHLEVVTPQENQRRTTLPAKSCLACGKSFTPGWAIRKYCSRLCSNRRHRSSPLTAAD